MGQQIRLCDAELMDGRRCYFAVKINFEGEDCSVKHRTAIITATQVALDFARDLRCEASLQVFATQPNCGLTYHGHSPPWKWVVRV